MIIKRYKYRIYPNKEQKVLIEKHFGCARFVYNYALAKQKESIEQNNVMLSQRVIQDEVVKLKKNPDYAWLNEVNSQSILASLYNAQSSVSNFRTGKSGSKSVRYKSKKDPHQAFSCPQKTRVKFDENKIWLPKLFDIKAKISRKFDGKAKTSTVFKTATNKYYISVIVETPDNLTTPTTISKDETVGIDCGINHLLILSNGLKFANQKYFVNSQKKLAIEQKIFARKKKDSKNYGKSRLSVATIHEKVKFQRLDYQHKITHELICKNQATTYAIESLNVKGMVRNRKLAKSISDAAWSQFIEILKYKASWNGKNILVIDRFAPSSKLCSCCGHKLEKLSLSVREWNCPSCGTEHDRDINASINIKNIAIADALGESVELKSSLSQ